MKTVADQFAATLAAAGIKRIYGIVGDNLNGLTTPFAGKARSNGFMSGTRKSPLSPPAPRPISQASSRSMRGVVDPGLHLIDGLFDCHRSRVPVLGIAYSFGGNRGRLFRRDSPANTL